jgi:hypothetical protein
LAIVKQGREFGMMVADVPRIVMTDTIERPPNLAIAHVKQPELDRTPQARRQHVLLFLFRDCHAKAGSVRHDVMGIRSERRPGKHKKITAHKKHPCFTFLPAKALVRIGVCSQSPENKWSIHERARPAFPGDILCSP